MKFHHRDSNAVAIMEKGGHTRGAMLSSVYYINADPTLYGEDVSPMEAGKAAHLIAAKLKERFPDIEFVVCPALRNHDCLLPEFIQYLDVACNELRRRWIFELRGS